MPAEVVDDTVFAIGLAEIFRERMKVHETDVLLPLAATACAALDLPPVNPPVEGYYAESAALARYFRLVRALQEAPMRPASTATGRSAVERLRELYHSPAMGRVEETDRVLPRTSSPFGEALRVCADWSVEGLARAARDLLRPDDAGLVAVAAATGSALAILTARESVALAADVELADADSPDTAWTVTKSVAEVAKRFVGSLADCTGIELPPPEPKSARVYFEAWRDAPLARRCVLVGERLGRTHPFYHWYVAGGTAAPEARDFWSSHVWTTESLRSLPPGWRLAAGAALDAPHP